MSSNSLLVLAPLAAEARAVRRALPGARVVRTGMGPAAARRAAERTDGATAVAVAGLCGAIAPGLRPGDLVVATEIVGPDGTRTPTSAAPLLAALARHGVTAHAGPIASVRHPSRGAERERLRADTGALAADMESAWVAEETNGRPLAVLRAVVDTPDRELRRLGTAVRGLRALRSLRRAAPALESWAAAAGPRRVLLAGPRSFCAGVERAIDIVELTLDRFGPPVYVRKQIVHNIHVVRDLERRGAIFVESVEEVPSGSTLVFSAHGVSPQVRREADDRELRVIDATCPLVTKVHAEARRFAKKGYTIFLLGHDGHEEVEGTTGEAPDAIRLVDPAVDPDEVEVEDPERVAFLTQTTLAADEVEGVVSDLRKRLPLLVGPRSDDICYATQNRQDAVKAIAAECDLMLVIGSDNSSNSKRLVEVSEREGSSARLIDDETEIDPAWLADASTVGVTAGASAPAVLVDRVVEALATLGPVEVEERTVTEESTQFTLPKELRS